MSTGDKLTCAVVGLGRIGLGYDLAASESEVFSHTKAFMTHPGYELLAGADPSAERRSEFEAFSRKPAYQNLTDLLSNCLPDVIAIAVPTELHLPAVRDAAKDGVKLLLLEKPIALNTEEASSIARIAGEKGIKLFVNYMRRCDPGLRELTTDIKRGFLGRPVAGRLIYCKGLFNNASHFLSLCIDWFGMPHSLQAAAPKRASWSHNDLDIEFTLDYGEFTFSAQVARDDCYGIGEIDLFFENGRVQLLDFGERIECFEVRDGKRNVRRLFPSGYKTQPQMSRYQYNVAEHIWSWLNGREVDIDSFRNAELTLELCQRLAQKAME
ncbi:MAG: Gfo/Idh/MocA family oxidoreductase [Deltaproteobacteria bacterium]|nr:Gfo/Idh/MocA family oxidoreductase [Deltaproteobacteria bacterium]